MSVVTHKGVSGDVIDTIVPVAGVSIGRDAFIFNTVDLPIMSFLTSALTVAIPMQNIATVIVVKIFIYCCSVN